MDQDCFVCRECLSDSGLIDFFDFEYNKSPAIVTDCAFCNRKNVPVMSANQISDYISCFVTEGYSRCVDSAPYMSREGGYQTQVFDFYEDIFCDYCGSIGSEEFEEYVVSHINEDDEPYQEGESFTVPNIFQRLCWGRDAFFRHAKGNDLYKYDEYGVDSPDVFLQKRLPIYFAKCKCIKNEKRGTIIYRGRQVDTPLGSIVNFNDITSPPKECVVKENRFSEAKVSMFYGALDKETAREEISYENKKHLYLGEFSLIHDVKILDLSSMDSPNGLFDMNWKGEYLIWKFMSSFSEEISKRAEDKNVDYKPTQKICDYIKREKIIDYVLEGGEYFVKKKIHLDGIKYKSCITGGVCYVFFWDQEESRHHLNLVNCEYIEK